MTPKTAPPKFNPDVYTKIALNDLVLYSAYYLHRRDSAIASEDIVSACFVLFPKRFSLRKYPHWPDSAVVSRRWSDCKSKGYLRGDAAKGFKLTARGIKHAEKIGKSLGKPLRPVRAPKPGLQKNIAAVQIIHPELKAHAGKYVRSIQASDAYKHYMKQVPLNEFDFRSLLLCTMESPPETLARNLEQFKEYVKMYKRRDLYAFLEYCEGMFSHVLGRTRKPVERKAQKKAKK